MCSSRSAGKSRSVLPRLSKSAWSLSTRMRSTMRDIRFEVEMISDPVAVMKMAGVIIAVSVE